MILELVQKIKTPTLKVIKSKFQITSKIMSFNLNFLQQDIIFPSVYICNSNHYRQSFIQPLEQNETEFTQKVLMHQFFLPSNMNTSAPQYKESLDILTKKMKNLWNLEAEKSPIIWFSAQHCPDLILNAGQLIRLFSNLKIIKTSVINLYKGSG